MTNKLEIEPSVLKALFAPNASFRQRKDACEKARAVYEAWEFAAPVVERQESVGDWAIDHSAGRPILVLKGCSVIEAEDAAYIMGLITKDREQPAPVAVVMPERPDAIIEGVMTSVGITHAIYACTVALKDREQVKLYRNRHALMVLPERKATIAFGEPDIRGEAWNACLDKVKELIPTTAAASNNLRNFANAMIDIAIEGADADGGHIQELAIKHGLLKPEQRTERCGDTCSCAEYADFPVECFRKVKELDQSRAS